MIMVIVMVRVLVIAVILIIAILRIKIFDLVIVMKTVMAWALFFIFSAQRKINFHYDGYCYKHLSCCIFTQKEI